MAVLAAAGSFNVTTAAAANTVVVSGLTDGDGGGSFTPTVVLFFWSGRTESVATVGRANQNRGFGVATSPTSRWAIGSQSNDAAGTALTSGSSTNAACIISCGDTVIDGAMDLQSFDSGGFTLVIDDAFPTDLRVGFLALGGDVVGSTGVLTPTGTAPVTQAVAHGLGRIPAAVLFGNGGAFAGAPPFSVIDSQLMLGAMSAAGGEGVTTGASNDGSNTMVTAAYAIGTECIASLANAVNTVVNRAEFSSVDGTNFTINWLERADARRILWLALGGTDVQAAVGNLLTQTDTSTGIPVTVGFRPKGILFGSACRAASTTDTLSSHDSLSIGAAASVSQRAVAASLDENGVGTSEVTTYISPVQVYGNISTTAVMDGSMDLQSVENTGFIGIMTNGDPSQSFVWYLALGNTAPSPKRLHLNQAVNRAATF